MTFPSVAEKGTFYNTGAATPTAHAVDLPDTISSGNLLLLLFSSDTTGAVTWPSSPAFTEIFQANSSTTSRISAAYRIADGTETGTVTVTTSATEATGRIWRITGWKGSVVLNTTGISYGTASSGASATAPDPPSLSPGWGADDTLWVAFCGLNNGLTGPTVYPYANDNEFADAAGQVGQANCSKNLNTATDNPGTFTDASTGGWAAQTIAIQPGTSAPPWDPQVNAPEKIRTVASPMRW